MISEIIQFINEKFNILMVLANIIVVCFYFMQWRESKRPILYIKLLSEKNALNSEYKLESKPNEVVDCSHGGGAYLVISNESEHIAENIRVDFILKSQNEKIFQTQKLSYLNPKESASSWVNFNFGAEDMLELVKVSDKKYTLPKQTLHFILYVNVTFGHWPLKYSINDSYYVQWRGLDVLPKSSPYVDIRAYNHRGGMSIHKTFGKNNSPELFQVG